jgi:hypothetical protein
LWAAASFVNEEDDDDDGLMSTTLDDDDDDDDEDDDDDNARAWSLRGRNTSKARRSACRVTPRMVSRPDAGVTR